MNDPLLTQSQLLQVSGSYWKTCALHAATMLNVFTPLGNGEMTAPQLAVALGCDQRALSMLLTALTAMGLLSKSDDSYSLSQIAKDLLVKTSPGYIGYIIRHHHRLMASWSRLPEAVKTGQPIRTRDGGGDDQEDFLLGMFNLASAIAPNLAQVIDLSGKERLLDLGGGPGTYAIHFCLANPGLRASVFDLASSRPFAESVIKRFTVQDRVEFLAGDYLRDAIPGSYDVAWLSQILHAEGPEGCMTILTKAAKALKPGGLLLIHEFILSDAMDGPEFPALFSLNMLLGTSAGQSYSESQIKEMMARVGGKNIRRLDFTGPNDSGVLCAVMA